MPASDCRMNAGCAVWHWIPPLHIPSCATLTLISNPSPNFSQSRLLRACRPSPDSPNLPSNQSVQSSAVLLLSSVFRSVLHWRCQCEHLHVQPHPARGRKGCRRGERKESPVALHYCVCCRGEEEARSWTNERKIVAVG